MSQVPYSRVKLARDNSRPTGLDYIRNIFKGFIEFHGDRRYGAPQGLQDLLTDRLTAKPLYPIIHLLDGGGSWDDENRCVKDSVELAFTHCNQSGERYYSYFSGRCTPQGGRHQDALRREIVHTLNAYYGIKRRADCLCYGLVAALSVHVESCPTGDEQEVWNEIVKSKYDFTVKAKRLICDLIINSPTNGIRKINPCIFNRFSGSAYARRRYHIPPPIEMNHNHQ